MKKYRFYVIIILTLILAFVLVSYNDMFLRIKGIFYNRDLLYINMRGVDSHVEKLAQDSSNRLVLKAYVRDRYGLPVENINLLFEVKSGRGRIYPESKRTNKFGECLVYYIPSDSSDQTFEKKASLCVTIDGSNNTSRLDIPLQRVPLVLVHGYRENSNIFDNLEDFMISAGYECALFDYDSRQGVISAAEKLTEFLNDLKSEYMKRGIKVEKFDMITHSMGGLVARYYSTSNDYTTRNDIRKLIFVSVPHKGSVWASAGVGYFNDRGVKDLVPDSILLSDKLPDMLNSGLNNTIQTGNLIGHNDEVVTTESASLDAWGIETVVFNLGDNSLSDNFFGDDTFNSKNHKAILNNTRVFKKIMGMLKNELPYPLKIN